MFNSAKSMQDTLTLFEVARYAAIVLLILCIIGMILSTVRYAQDHNIEDRHQFCLWTVGLVVLVAVLLVGGSFKDSIQEEAAEQAVTESMLYAGADFVVTDKKINTGLFNTTYEMTIALPEPPEGGVATLRLRITEDQYNKTRIGDTWNYQSDH